MQQSRFSLHCHSLTLSVASLLSVLPIELQADITLPSILSDHMVLQKAATVPIWGKADPDEEVRVTLNNQTAKTVTNADGRWRVELDLNQSESGPFTLTVEGKNKITVSDVVVGEVWVASGQSNMEYRLQGASDASHDMAAPPNPFLRQFTIENTTALTPQEDCPGSWSIASPETAKTFSAVGFHFARKLQTKLKVPVGIISADWGGTPVEAWTPAEGLDRDPELKAAKERSSANFASYPQRRADFIADMTVWLEKTGRQETPPPGNATTHEGSDAALESWTNVSFPGAVKGPGLLETGIFWLRRDIIVDKRQAGRDLVVDFDNGPRDGFETVYWNGEKIGTTDIPSFEGDGSNRRHIVPGKMVREGSNSLALRIFAPIKTPSFNGIRCIRVAGALLQDGWQARMEKAFPPLSPAETASAPRMLRARPVAKNETTQLYNAMISPIVGYRIRGVIWYQGEANASNADRYRRSFPILIESWRAKWNQGEFPFYFCQLANFMIKDAHPPEKSTWAELREAQAMTLKLPNTGQAVLIDIGEEADIHPRNKRDVGERLARIALARDYDQDIIFSAPIYESMTVENDKIRVKFSNTSAGLKASPLPETYQPKSSAPETKPLVKNSPNSELQGFAICGADRKWFWADARIEGDTVVVWSTEVPSPIATRYAWANNPTCNLSSREGLPVSPFRTDDFPAPSIP